MIVFLAVENSLPLTAYFFYKYNIWKFVVSPYLNRLRSIAVFTFSLFNSRFLRFKDERDRILIYADLRGGVVFNSIALDRGIYICSPNGRSTLLQSPWVRSEYISLVGKPERCVVLHCTSRTREVNKEKVITSIDRRLFIYYFPRVNYELWNIIFIILGYVGHF